MKLLILIISFLLVFTGLHSQNFIGMHKQQIIDTMKVTNKNFKQNRDVVNKVYKYLKYEDHISEQTMLFFLSETDHCTLVRLMSDYSNINEITQKLDKSYRKTAKNTWAYSEKGKNYSVLLEEGEWYFTVTFKQN